MSSSSSEVEENETEPTPFVTPVVKDDEGRKISRTMRRIDKLQDLTEFYYAMVPTVPHGKGVFLYRGKRVDGERTPADYGMEDGYQIDFFLELKPSSFITMKMQDPDLCIFTRTMRRTDRLKDCLDYYYTMVPNPTQVIILHHGRRVSEFKTPMELEMMGDEDWLELSSVLPPRPIVA
ncbi:hypothetical protein PR202_gb21371 [Eleusine coracana subsp. coracana]|uniref:Ubiquitin-like domain-containing protein n=1 Tax=Eleusine coracana subsp. coracana TaxID=191504 RepID=A0AAV5FAZ0_ELECO|nr:hypothetical protein QOZ80_7BG0605260 [Eleusine coracana subsp. coracana]GJN32834.1 hypothetical protein PR202_gb21371 [Eleusine coracana subsp. coracana]